MSDTQPSPNAQACPSATLYVPASSPVYELGQLIWKGVPPPDAAKLLGLTESRAKMMIVRLRKRAAHQVGRRVSDVFMWRMVFTAHASASPIQTLEKDIQSLIALPT